MDRQHIRKSDGQYVGYIDTLPNGDMEAKDKFGRYIGKYVKITDTTKDKFGRTVYRGNQLSMLFVGTI